MPRIIDSQFEDDDGFPLHQGRDFMADFGQLFWSPFPAYNEGLFPEHFDFAEALGVFSAKKPGFPGWAEEHVHGYTERWANGDSEFKRVFVVPWGSRAAFRDYVLGYSEVTTEFEPGPPRIKVSTINRVPPLPDCEFPSFYAVRMELIEACGKAVRRRYFSEADLENAPPGDFDPAHPFYGGDGVTIRDKITIVAEPDTPFGSIKDGFAKYAVTFRQLPYSVRTNEQADAIATGFEDQPREMSRYIRRERSYNVQALPMHRLNERLVFTEGELAGKVIPESGVRLLPSATLLYEQYEVPYFPSKLVSETLGRVNADLLDGVEGWEKHSAGTLLMQPPIVREMPRNIRGGKMYNVTWRFDVAPLTYNTTEDGGPGTWNHTFAADGKIYPYGYATAAEISAIETGLQNQVLTPRPVYKSAKFKKLFSHIFREAV